MLLVVIALAVVVIVVPKVAGATPLTVLTSSMAPGLPPGTLIVVRPVDADELGVGDIVTYQLRAGEPEVVTHRVVGMQLSTTGERSFVLQGDNNSVPDPSAVLPEQVRGRVWYSVPFVGLVSSAVNGENRAWILPAVAMLLLSYAGYAIASGVTAAVKGRRSRVTR